MGFERKLFVVAGVIAAFARFGGRAVARFGGRIGEVCPIDHCRLIDNARSASGILAAVTKPCMLGGAGLPRSV